jgi:hypothetical protein
VLLHATQQAFRIVDDLGVVHFEHRRRQRTDVVGERRDGGGALVDRREQDVDLDIERRKGSNAVGAVPAAGPAMQTPRVDRGDRQSQQIASNHVDDRDLRADRRPQRVEVGDVLQLGLESAALSRRGRVPQTFLDEATLRVGRLCHEDLASHVDARMTVERRDQPRTAGPSREEDDEAAPAARRPGFRGITHRTTALRRGDREDGSPSTPARPDPARRAPSGR